MTVKMNLWSLTLLPGEPVPIYVPADFEITNVALGEELRNETGRSVVKVTHNPIDPALLASDSDDEFDSDDEDFDGELDEDEDDEDEDEIDAEEEDDDEEDDEDDEDEDDFSDDGIEETSVIASLTAGRVEQAQVNLTFVKGEVVIFEVTGENAVHLLGNYINQWPDEEDSDYDSDDYDDIDLDDEDEFDVEEFDEEVEVAPTGKITAVEEIKAIKAAKPAAASNKRKAEEVEDKPEVETLTKAQKKKLAKKAKLEEAGAAAPAAAAPAPAKTEKKKTLPGGLIIEDVTVGTGPVAKPGKRLSMRYIGKLESGKQFDANTAGSPFSFVLGRGEVIKGWDQGLVGLAVGGERRLTIPASLAYGKQRLGGIPPNSTLKFDVKLLAVK
ncbi:peptidylprolyl isomerase fpr3 [Vanrija albida]|uniref:FK506-binding protein n=1 Tax=Vanrija albida TaxID=181172 RepID=A0ABR3PRT8_9TREE